jgi:hypothetical protein
MPSTAAIALAGLQALKSSQAQATANNATEKFVQKYQGLSEVNKIASLKVPTLGTNLAKQNLEQKVANQIGVLQQGGATTVLGGMPSVARQAQEENLQLAAQADEMQYQRDAAVAQQEQNIETNRLNREAGLLQSQIAGSQAARAEAATDYNTGVGGIIEGLGGMSELAAYKKAMAGNNPNITLDKLKANKPGAFDWGSIFSGLFSGNV